MDGDPKLAAVRLRRWRVARVAAVVVMLSAFFLFPAAFVVHFALGGGPMNPWLFRLLAIGTLSSIPLGIAGLMLAQRRLLQAALAETTLAAGPSTPIVLVGGARTEGRNASYPLARLNVDPARLWLRILGQERFACERAELASIEPQRWFLGSGLEISTARRKVVFFPLNPVALVHSLRGAGYVIQLAT